MGGFKCKALINCAAFLGKGINDGDFITQEKRKPEGD